MGLLRTMGSIDRLEMLSASESLETPSIDQSQGRAKRGQMENTAFLGTGFRLL